MKTRLNVIIRGHGYLEREYQMKLAHWFSCLSLLAQPSSLLADVSLPFSEFQKVISVRSSLLPIKGMDESLALAVLPQDPYAKIYRVHHKDQTFKLAHDAGRNVAAVFSNHSQDRFFFLLDNNGDENYQIHELLLTTGATKKIFGKDGFRATPLSFSQDDRRLYFRSNHLSKKIYSIYSYNLASGHESLLTDGKNSYDGAVVSPSEKHIFLLQALGNNETHVFKLNLKRRKAQKIFAEKGTIFSPQFFSEDEKYLYVNTDWERDRMYCGRILTETASLVEPIRRSDDRDIECDYDERGTISFAIESFDGQKTVAFYKGIFEQEFQTPIPGKVLVGALSRVDGTRRVHFRMSKADSPGDFFSIDLDQGEKSPLTQLTKTNQSSIREADFAKSYDIRYKSFDGLSIHGIIFAKEEWLKDGVKRPVILWPHGGPDSLVEHAYSPIFQYWVLNGYVVFAPNFRGSTGYGKRFERLNDKDWGGGHIKDLIWGKNEIAKLSYVDPARIYIVGASFGGFSTLSAITQYPTEFAGAVAIVALANLFTFAKSIPPDPAWQNEFRTELGDAVKDKKLFEERSPYFKADKIRIPLKIYQAENDVRTVKAEMDQFAAKLQEAKIPVQYEVLANEGHSLGRTESREKVFEGTIRFLNGLTPSRN
jgi:dipeptidyl aminopeptidase/acylaminoacyl peptidase